MTIEDKLNSVLNSFCAMAFKEPELCSQFRLPLNLLSEVINEVENLPLCAVSQQREQLEGFVDWFNANDKTQAILSERIEEYLKTL